MFEERNGFRLYGCYVDGTFSTDAGGASYAFLIFDSVPARISLSVREKIHANFILPSS